MITSRKSNRTKGFTLIELVVVFSVIAVLSSIGIASFVESSRNATLQSAVNEVTSILNIAKSRALSQTKPTDLVCGITSVDSLSGYRVNINTTKPNISLVAVCGITPDSIQGYQYSLPDGITLPVGNDSYFFPVLTHGVDHSGLIIIKGYGNKQTTITVNKSGVITTAQN